MEQTQIPGAGRTRAHTWSDPLASAAAVPTRSGLDFLRAMGEGGIALPPVMSTLAIEPVEVEEGRIVFALQPAEFHYNPIGTVHGGVLATLLDSATGCAVHSTLPAGTGYTSLDLSTRFLRPATVASGRLTCTGTVVSRGTRTAMAEARITDPRDRLLAHATSTCLLFPLTG